MRTERPGSDEYNPYYARYIALVPDGDIVRTLRAQFSITIRLLEGVRPEQELYRYAEGKWSIREVVGHLIDTEAMFTGRILWIARQPEIALPGMDQDLWTERGGANDRELADLIETWGTVRDFTVAVLDSLPDFVWGNRGMASDSPVTVRAMPWMIAGHARYHRELLKSDYGVIAGD